MTYEPAPDHAKLFAKHKRAVEIQRETADPLREAAGNALLAGATNKELAELTGLSTEYFRKLAREVGAARQKPPTVGKDAPQKPTTQD